MSQTFKAKIPTASPVQMLTTGGFGQQMVGGNSLAILRDLRDAERTPFSVYVRSTPKVGDDPYYDASTATLQWSVRDRDQYATLAGRVYHNNGTITEVTAPAWTDVTEPSRIYAVLELESDLKISTAEGAIAFEADLSSAYPRTTFTTVDGITKLNIELARINYNEETAASGGLLSTYQLWHCGDFRDVLQPAVSPILCKITSYYGGGLYNVTAYPNGKDGAGSYATTLEVLNMMPLAAGSMYSIPAGTWICGVPSERGFIPFRTET